MYPLELVAVPISPDLKGCIWHRVQLVQGLCGLDARAGSADFFTQRDAQRLLTRGEKEGPAIAGPQVQIGRVEGPVASL